MVPDLRMTQANFVLSPGAGLRVFVGVVCATDSAGVAKTIANANAKALAALPTSEGIPNVPATIIPILF
jgi:hypothetical protein